MLSSAPLFVFDVVSLTTSLFLTFTFPSSPSLPCVFMIVQDKGEMRGDDAVGTLLLIGLLRAWKEALVTLALLAGSPWALTWRQSFFCPNAQIEGELPVPQ